MIKFARFQKKQNDALRDKYDAFYQFLQQKATTGKFQYKMTRVEMEEIDQLLENMEIQDAKLLISQIQKKLSAEQMKYLQQALEKAYEPQNIWIEQVFDLLNYIAGTQGLLIADAKAVLADMKKPPTRPMQKKKEEKTESDDENTSEAASPLVQRRDSPLPLPFSISDEQLSNFRELRDFFKDRALLGQSSTYDTQFVQRELTSQKYGVNTFNLFQFLSKNFESFSKEQQDILKSAGAQVLLYNTATQQWMDKISSTTFPFAKSTREKLQKQTTTLFFTYKKGTKQFSGQYIQTALNAFALFIDVMLLVLAPDGIDTLKVADQMQLLEKVANQMEFDAEIFKQYGTLVYNDSTATSETLPKWSVMGHEISAESIDELHFVPEIDLDYINFHYLTPLSQKVAAKQPEYPHYLPDSLLYNIGAHMEGLSENKDVAQIDNLFYIGDESKANQERLISRWASLATLVKCLSEEKVSDRNCRMIIAEIERPWKL